MKKIIIFVIAAFLILTGKVIYVSAEEAHDVKDASYEAVEKIDEKTLEYDVKYEKVIGKSTYGNTNMDLQSINVLSIPKNEAVRVVSWTYSSTRRWTMQTVQTMAEDFELNNPGWRVIGAINADFFDINGNKNLPYSTNGACVTNGDVYRAAGSQNEFWTSLGFKNDGSATSLVGNLAIEYSKSHYLAVFDDMGQMIKEFPIDSLNTAPGDNEISVYFSYPISQKARDVEKMTCPSENSYLVLAPQKCLCESATQMFGRGAITKVNEGKELELGDFAIVTNNEEVQSYLKEGVEIRVQQNVVGDFKDCDNITGVGAPILQNNNYLIENYQAYGDTRQPRTVVGVKEDGTIMFFTIDGRQEAINMYGMTYTEIAALCKSYNCVEAYNLDGGGSTTMIIRNKMGQFETVNSPSDGCDRNDSNSLLIVAPIIDLDITEITDTTVKVSTPLTLKNLSIENIQVTINDQTKTIKNESEVWTGLNKQSDYTIDYTYDIIYKGKTFSKIGKEINFTTGKTKPLVHDCYYQEMTSFYYINFVIEDPDAVVSMVMLKYFDKNGANKISFLNVTDKSTVIKKENVGSPDFILSIDYNYDSYPLGPVINETIKVIEKVDEKEKQDDSKKEEPRKNCSCKKDIGGTLISIFAASSLLYILMKKSK